MELYYAALFSLVGSDLPVAPVLCQSRRPLPPSHTSARRRLGQLARARSLWKVGAGGLGLVFLLLLARSPSAPLLLFWGRVPLNRLHQKVGTLILSSLPEDLAGFPLFATAGKRKGRCPLLAPMRIRKRRCAPVC